MAKVINIKNSDEKKRALGYVKKSLKGVSIPKKSHRYILNLTEAAIDRVRDFCKDDHISVSVGSGLGEKIIKIICDAELPEDVEKFAKTEILSYSTDYISIKNKDGKGTVIITVKGSASYALVKTFFTVGLGLLIAFAINCFQWNDFSYFAFTYITMPIVSLFVNALQMIATPVTFFAVICSTSFFYSYLREGVIGKNLFFRYVISAAVSVIIGGTLFYFIPDILPPGSMSQFLKDTNDANQSFPDFITSLIPSNIIDPFVSGNSMQLLILAIIFGIAIGALTHKNSFIRKLVDSIDEIFIAVLNMIFVFSPYALFFAVLGISIGGQEYEFDLVFSIFITIVCGLVILVLIRCLILKINKFNLKWFFKSYKPFFSPVMVTGSTIECIPENIKNCRANFKLPNKYLKQSVTFCAHNNMDGNCLFLGVVCCAIAYGCGIEYNIALVGALVIFAIVLSAGAPNQPGSGIICMAVLLPAMGVDSVLIIYVVLLDLMLETLIACTNNFSDMVTIVCLFKRKGLIK